MYNILLTLQVAAMIISFICVALLILQKGSDTTKLMLVTCLCAFIQNSGYYLEMCSKNLSEVMISIRLEYVGTAFIMTMLMIFVFRYCRVKLLEWVKWALLVIDILVLICVWTYEYVPFYYVSASFSESGAFPHVVLEKGFLYIIFCVATYGEFLASAAVSFITMVRTEDANMKKNYRMLFMCCTIPCLFYIAGIAGAIEGYDPTPLGSAAGIIIFGFAIIVRRVFDVVETAHENILMELDDAIVILDYKRGFQEANKAAIALFPELAATQFGQLVPIASFNELIDKKDNEDVEIGGRYYRVHVNELHARSGLDSSFIGYSVVLFDITDQKQQLAQMTELKIAADSANKAKSSFLANVSHEIRTPINVVVGMSDVILRDYDDQQLLGYASNIQRAANTLLELINDILDFSKIESGRVELSNAEYRANDFFRDIMLVFSHKGEEKNIDFITNIKMNIPSVLFGDVMRIKQVVTNILTNAFKYTREGSVTLKADFEKTGERRGNLIISVEDTGIGIRKEELDKIFEIFVRLDERLNKSIEGAGLGLNITKNLVDLMGGQIKVYSEYGKGSVFTVIIPQGVRSKEGEVIGEIKEDEQISKRSGIGYEAPDAKVLVIDDSKTNLIVAKALLRDTKAIVTTGTSGEECLKLVKENHYDVIFLDHRMPIMDGVETFKNMQNMEHKCEDTPVIMLTANAVSNARDFYVKEGFADFISKPICEESITGMLRKYLPSSLVKEV